MFNDYKLPEPVYVGTPQLLQSIIDCMPKSILSGFKEYSDAEDKDAVLNRLIDDISIYEIDAFVFWAETYARLERYKNSAMANN